MKVTQKVYIVSAAVVAIVFFAVVGAIVGATNTDHRDISERLQKAQQLPDALKGITGPSDDKPQWYEDQVTAEKQAASRGSTRAVTAGSRVVTYTILSKGAIGSDLSEFAAQANQTLNDQRG